MGLSNYILLKDTRNPILRASVGNSLQLWLDANDSATITESSGFVSQWADKSGNGNHAVQASGSLQPSLQANIQNNKSVVDFDGGDFLLAGNFSTFDSSGQTVFVVGQTSSTGFQIYVAKFFSGENGTFFVGQSDDTVTYATNGGSGRVDDATIGQWKINDTQIMVCTFDNSFISTSRNNVLLSGTVAQTAPLQTNALTVTIGGTSAGSLKLTGFVAEVLIYNRKLSTAEITAINRYLATKWAIGISAPDNIGSLQLWLDANDNSTITESGNKVSQWDDKSGNGNHALQSTGVNQPTITTDHINGKAVITFDGGLEEMDLTSTLSLTGEFTMFFVANNVEGTTTRTIFGNSGTNNKITVVESDRMFVRIINAGSSDSSQSYPSGGVTNIQTIKRDSSDKIDMAFDGAAFTRLFSDAAQAGTSAYNRVGVDTTFNWQGDIAEILIYNRSLSPVERTLVETYLSNKWGVTLA